MTHIISSETDYMILTLSEQLRHHRGQAEDRLKALRAEHEALLTVPFVRAMKEELGRLREQRPSWDDLRANDCNRRELERALKRIEELATTLAQARIARVQAEDQLDRIRRELRTVSSDNAKLWNEIGRLQGSLGGKLQCRLERLRDRVRGVW